MNRLLSYIGVTLIIFMFFGCGDKTAPKPFAYPHIDNGATKYSPHNQRSFPLTFDIANNAKSQSDTLREENKNFSWINIIYPQYNATIYCTYIKAEGKKLDSEKKRSRELVYVHSQMASNIEALHYSDSTRNIEADIYTLKGRVATPLQFVATDKSSFIFRGSLYFNNEVNIDSVAPIIEYIKEDIAVMIESITPQ